MELDAKQFADDAILDTDVCIVGAGPAGLVLAAELAGRQGDVILLESGKNRSEPAILALNDGDVRGDEYAGLGPTRHRSVGGTSLLWNTPIGSARAGGTPRRSQRGEKTPGGGVPGAKYLPLDASDFLARPGIEHSGWPFGLTELFDHYVQAQRTCGLGPFSYDAESWTREGCDSWMALGPDLISRVYQLGVRDALLSPLRATIDRATNVRLCTHATALSLQRDASGRHITSIRVGTPGGARWSVRARRVVLACGAVENARILLVSDDGRGAPGNGSDWVGRGFMEHPRDRALALYPRSRDVYARSRFYDVRKAANGIWIVGRVALSDAAVASGAVLNASATLIPRPSAATQGLRAALPGFVEPWLPSEAHGWSRTRGAAHAFSGFTVLMNLEQTPHPENRVTLSARRDSLGVPLPSLHWQWRADDHHRLERLRTVMRSALEAVGSVSVNGSAPPDPNAHHHAGTTRMHDDPKHGVTDRHGRVHGTDNLFVAGASTFPTSGFANPMLTIIALTLRLARYLEA